MGTEGNPAARRKAASSGNKAKFDAIWRDLRAEFVDHRRINLSLAANIVGFATFPVGWSWTECPPKQGKWRPEAFSKAEALGRLDIPSNGKSTRDGMRAFRRGAAFRLKAVERKLYQLVMIQSIPAWLTGRSGVTHAIDDKTRLHHSLFVDAKKSRVGLHELVWYAETDALSVFDVVENRCAWRRKNSKNDWLLIERIAREKIEEIGLPTTQAKLQDTVIASLVDIAPTASPPHRTEVLEMLASLMVEYGESEN